MQRTTHFRSDGTLEDIIYQPGQGILVTNGDRPELTWYDTT
ncbi:hypothetical protein ACFL3H_10145 [Gemmatimonadota bacterium]